MINYSTQEVITTAFARGKVHDFRLYKESKIGLLERIRCLADTGYQGLNKLHHNSETPTKKPKHNPLAPEEKRANRHLAQQRIFCEHAIRRLKVFRVLSERYRNRRRRFGLRFNLIASICNGCITSFLRRLTVTFPGSVFV